MKKAPGFDNFNPGAFIIPDNRCCLLQKFQFNSERKISVLFNFRGGIV